MAGVSTSELLEGLHAPALALARREPADEDTTIREAADALFAAGAWRKLAVHYDRLATAAWNGGNHAAALRLLLASRSAALRAGDSEQTQESTFYLAHYHRLRGNRLPAERWNLEQLASELTATTALGHVRSYRELAAIQEQTRDYEQGMTFVDRAESVCALHPQVAGMDRQHVRVLLQRSVLERLRGHYEQAFRATRAARSRAAEIGPDRMLLGLIDLREASIHTTIGNTEAALRSYQEAETRFTGISVNNVFLVQLRQVTCLRELGRYDQAFGKVRELTAEFGRRRDIYRLRQVLLEQAEVLQEMGMNEQVRDLLARAEPHFDGVHSVEAMRYHRHRARNLIALGEDDEHAARHLMLVLRMATEPGRRDLSRVVFALHDLLRIPHVAGLVGDRRLAVSRGALAAVEVQRDSLTDVEARWALHRIREDVYASSALVHHDAGHHEAAARIIEIGRADVINNLLTAGGGERSAAVLPDPEPPVDHISPDGVFDLARSIATVLDGEPKAEPRLLPLPLGMPADTALDDLADLVVLTQIGGDEEDGWWSCTAVRPRGGVWRTTLRTASGPVGTLVARLVQGDALPDVGHHTWNALGEFLLPDAAIWSTEPRAPANVLISPDPRLWQVPYAALRRDGIDLIENATITLTPSLRTQVLLRSRRNGLLLSPELPVVSLTDPSLPGHGIERAGLGRWPGGHHEIGSPADLAQSRPAALFYVSGNGQAAGESTLGTTGITMEVLAAAALPPVVLLNGCWSGTAMSRFGRDPFTLAVGALLGGAHLVIAGTGLIGGVASALVGGAALDSMAAGLRPGEAIRRAQRAVRDANIELQPQEWAGLCVVGDDR